MCTSRLATLAARANISGKDHTALRLLFDFSPAFYLGSTARGKGRDCRTVSFLWHWCACHLERRLRLQRSNNQNRDEARVQTLNDTTLLGRWLPIWSWEAFTIGAWAHSQVKTTIWAASQYFSDHHNRGKRSVGRRVRGIPPLHFNHSHFISTNWETDQELEFSW